MSSDLGLWKDTWPPWIVDKASKVYPVAISEIQTIMTIDNTWYLVTFPPCMADKTTSVVGAASVMERLDKAKKIKSNIFILTLPGPGYLWEMSLI